MKRRIAGLMVSCTLALTACGGSGGGEGTFQLGLSRDSLSMPPGSDQQIEVTIDRSPGFTGAVDLTFQDGPDGIEGSFDVSSATAASSTLTLSASQDVATGNYQVTVRGTGGGVSRTATLTLTVSDEPPSTAIEIDEALEPRSESLPPLGDGQPRPVATLTDASGVQADFVANELVLVTDDQAALTAFLDRHEAEVLMSVGPDDFGLGTLPTLHLIRMAPNPSEIEEFRDDLDAIDPDARSQLTVGSQEGLDLLATAAHEAAGGASVAVNWLGEGATFTDGLAEEAPVMQASPDRYTSSNVFDWSYMGEDDLAIGATQAWWALEAAGKLDERIKIAILDGGFLPNDDFPAGWEAASVVPGKEAVGSTNIAKCTGGSDCPWHGTNVAAAAAAVPDNAFGSAGPGGPVADLVLMYTSPDYFLANVALLESLARGADIVNMSFSARVPASVSWTVQPFDATTTAVRAAGVLIFAAAGNEGENVDAEDCFGGCWEEAWHTPCENGGVICVGGTGIDSKAKTPGSNYGHENVDIFAPFGLFVLADPTSPSNNLTRQANGTSVASPFAAGVAALIWAADPGQSAGQVESTLLATAHSSPDTNVNGYVNAFGGVKSILGGSPPAVTINAPTGEVTYGFPSSFKATVNDLEDGPDCCTVKWSSDLDGFLGAGNDVPIGLSAGTHEITATATDSDGHVGSDTTTVTAVNAPPDVEIMVPAQGDTLASNKTWVFNASVQDVNEFGLGCASLTWESDDPSDPVLSGCTPEVAFTTLGERTWTVTVTDSEGATGSDTVTIDVVEGPELWVTITNPVPGGTYSAGSVVELSAEISQAFETPATYEWGVSTDQQSFDAVASGNVLTVRGGEKVVPQESWEVPFAYEDKDVYVNLIIDAPNSTMGTQTYPPIHIMAVPK